MASGYHNGQHNQQLVTQVTVYGPTAWHYLGAWEKFRTLGSTLDRQNQNLYFVAMFCIHINVSEALRR